MISSAKTAIKLPSVLVRYPKSQAAYWKEEGRLFTQRGSLDYCCRFAHNGRRGFFDLNTPNKVDAQKRAADRYKFVALHGWDAAYKNPEFRTQAPEPKVEVLTVGTWIESVRAISLVRPLTFLSYEQALRRIAAEAVLNLAHTNKNHTKWVERVNEVPLAELTTEVVAKWQKDRLSATVGNPKAEEQARHTVNHILRSAKALFSVRKVLRKVGRAKVGLLPTPVPLSDVSLLEEDSSARFTPSVDSKELLLLARNELGGPPAPGESEIAVELREQQWIAFLLSFCAALRRRESDLLEWTQIDLDHSSGPRVQLEPTRHFKAKNRAHSKPIPLDPEVAALLGQYRRKHPEEKFVLISEREVIGTGIGKPRCHSTWRTLRAWLRAKGITDAKPVHALRKSIGAHMADKHGIHAAQRLLRHTTPAITSKYYSNSEAVERPGLGVLLSTVARA